VTFLLSSYVNKYFRHAHFFLGTDRNRKHNYTPNRKSVEPRTLCAISDVIVTSGQLQYPWLIANRSAGTRSIDIKARDFSGKTRPRDMDLPFY
jgi:hypothetical protein